MSPDLDSERNLTIPLDAVTLLAKMRRGAIFSDRKSFLRNGCKGLRIVMSDIIMMHELFIIRMNKTAIMFIR